MKFRTGIGQDSHRFTPDASNRRLMLGGVEIPGCPGLEGNSDSDVILHALTNALSGISGHVVLGPETDRMCREGITDSAAYVSRALETLGDFRPVHVSISVEGSRPKLVPHIPAIRARVASILGIEAADVAMTATSGEGLTEFGRGNGLQAFVVLTAAAG